MGLKFRRGTTAQKSGSLAFGEPYVNTDLGTLQIGGATGDITLGSSGTGSQGSFAGISGSSLDITGNAKIDGNLTLGGNITIGDNTSDTVSMTANLSSSIIPSITNTFDLGSASKQWRHVYISTGSIYMNGTAILSSNATDLILTTDNGQSLKLLETAADTITLQTAEGNLTLTSTGAGDVVLDPTTGVVSIKGTLQVQDGNKITSSGGNTIQFGNNVGITGSLRTTSDLTVGGNFVVNGTTTTIDSTNINIGDNIIVLNGTETTNGGMYVRDAAGVSTLTGSMLWDTTNDKWIAGSKGNELAILRVGGDSVVSGSSQIPALLPTGVVSGSSQTIANLPTGTVSGSSQITYASISSIPGGIVSGSSQIVGILSDLNTFTASNANTSLNTYTSSLNSAIQLTGSTVSFLGNIVVYGTQSVINSTNVELSDNILYLAPTGAIDNDLGVVGHYNDGTYRHAGIFMDASDGHSWKVFNGLQDETTGTVNTSGTGFTLADFKAGAITGTSFTGIHNGTINATNGIVSGSSQITYASISSIPGGIVSGSTQVTPLLPTGVVSGSAQTITNLPTGTVSGSSQVTLSSTTGYGTVINQNLLTTSDVRHNSLGIGMAASATAGRIDASGDVVAYSTSDKNFKENITPIENPIEKIRMISGNTYDWKADMKEFHGFEGNDVGVIAQEIEAVLPQLVTTRETGYKAVKYDKLVALLIEGIKAQQNQIDNLTIEIEKLKESKGL